MRRNLLGSAGVIAAVIFAIAGWLVVDLWAHPHTVEALRSAPLEGIRMDASAYSPLRMALPLLTIAGAHVLGALALFHPKLARTSLVRGGVLAGATAIGWVAALALFLPPDFTSWLIFSLPAGLLLGAAWIVALPSWWLLERLRSLFFAGRAR